MDDTPACHAGIIIGDTITKINNISTKNMHLNDSVKLLRGLPNSSVLLTKLYYMKIKFNLFLLKSFGN
ncbi:MAG: PDZ domain-containing protein [Bordetella sp.]|nr:MAG: PDZ domain-containing protein [Bordetella sp.]